MSKCCGIDADRFIRKGLKETSETDGIDKEKEAFPGFKAPIASAVVTDSYEDFSNLFVEVVDDVLSKYDSPPIVGSFDINKLTGNPKKSHELKKEILKRLSEEIEECRIIFSYFRDLSEIIFYGDGHTSSLSVKKFIERKLDNSYPHIAAWKMNQEGNYEIFMDSFAGHVTNAWRELEEQADVSIYSKGDQCNALIATADIILSYLDTEMEDRESKLYTDNVKPILEELGINTEADWLGNGFLPKITPRKRISIPTSKYLAKPTFYVLSTSNQYTGKKMLLNSPRGRDLIRAAVERDGCIKFFDKNQDKNFMKPDDFLIYVDEEGREAANILEKSGYDFNSLEISDTSRLVDED